MSRIWIKFMLALCAFFAIAAAITNECSTSEQPQAYIVAIDSSGSMRTSNRQTAARNAVRTFMTYLTNGVDYVNVIDFDSYAKCYGSCGWRKDSAYLSRSFYVDASGGTNFDKALALALSHAGNAYPGPAPISKTLLFLTDGAGTYTYCSNRYSAIYKLKQAGWRVFSIGLDVSSSYYINRLKDMATCTGGKYYADVDPSELQSVFTNIYQTSCSCGAGRYQPSGADYCADTQAGYYSPVNNNNRYTCPSGKVSAAKYSACVYCKSGGYAYSRTQCRANGGYYGAHSGPTTTYYRCPAGKYCPKDATSAISCTGNTYSGDGYSSCHACRAYSTNNGAHTGCYCNAGYYLSGGNCVKVGAGYYSPAGNNNRYSCTGNKYQPSTGQSSCKTCPTGSYTPGSTSCVACHAGYYCNGDTQTACGVNQWSAAGASGCSNCGTGGRSNAASSTCWALPGYYGTVRTGAFTACPVGKKCPGVTSAITGPAYDCPAGQYQGSTGKSYCNACPAHKYSAAGAASCSTCASGYVANSGHTGCVQCKAGKYASSTADACIACSGNTYSIDGTAGSCITCPANTHANSAHTRCLANRGYYISSWPATVKACPAGYRCPCNDGSTATACPTGTTKQACPTGQYQASTAQFACVACPKGKYQDATAQTSCKSCSAVSESSYSDVIGLSSCKSCAGTTPALPDGTACAPKCGASYYWGGSSCVKCPSTQWSAAGWPRSCSDCPAHSFVASTQTTCVAGPGYYKGPGTVSGAFSPCPIGHKCAGGSASSTSPVSATPCPAGQYQGSTGQTSCTTCGVHKYSAAGAASCSTCASGYVANSGHTGCVQCKAGKYAPTSSDTCTDCVGDTYSLDGAAGSCTACPANSHANSDHTACVPNRGYYLVAAPANINACEAGYKCPCADGSSVTECATGTARVPCPIGQYQDTTAQPSCKICQDLGRKYYSGSLGSTGCQACAAYATPEGDRCDDACTPGNHYVVADGSCVSCVSPKFSVGGYSETCSDCPANSVVNSGLSTCVAAAGYYEGPGIVADDFVECPTGHKCAGGNPADSDVPAVATPCPAGQYQGSTGQTSCTTCGVHKYSAAGAASCSTCASGYVANSGHTGCVQCKAGKYAPTSSDTCTDCVGDTYSLDGAAGSCTACPANSHANSDHTACVPNRGYYLVAAPANINACEAGYKCPCDGADEVLCAAGTVRTPCEPGYVQPDTAQGTCDPCPLGEYQDSRAQTVCISCSTVSTSAYSDSLGAASCKACADGAPAVPAADRCADKCAASEFWNGAACETCPSHQWSAAGWPLACNDCPSNAVVATNQQTCVAKATFFEGPGTDELSFVTCPTGHTCAGGDPATPEIPAAAVACPAGQFQDLTGQTVCKPCTGADEFATGGNSACDLCSFGNVATSDHTGCEYCPLGTYEASSGVCEPCPAGSFCDVGIIEACDGDTWTPIGSSECLACPAHSIGTDEHLNCTAVPGYYGVGTIDADINECGPGYFCEGKLHREACPVATYQGSSTGSKCITCASLADGLDRYAAGTATAECSTCPPGQLADSFHTGCYECPAGTFEEDLQCITCRLVDEWSPSGAPACTKCPVGSLANEDHTTCVIQPGYWLDGTNTTDVTQVKECPLGHKCVGDGAKIECPISYYQDTKKQSECKFCSDDNQYADITGLTACRSCPQDQVANDLHSGCIRCPASTYESITGLCTKCQKGLYSFAGTGCHECPVGSVIDPNQDSCVSAPGYYTSDELNYRGDENGDAVNTIIQCEAGYRCPGDNKRYACELGDFAPVAGLDECVPCETKGTDAWSPAGPQTDCQICPDGTVPSEDRSVCVDCPAGTFEYPSGICTSCGFNEWSAAGATFCSPCPRYTTNNDDHTDCVVNRGYYGTVVSGVADVTICPVGHKCTGGLDHSEPCVGDTYSDVEGLHTCFECVEGSVANEAHTGCNVCPDGKYEESENPGVCQECLAGHYCVEGMLIECPLGHAQDQTGQSSCKSCKEEGGWTPSTGQTICPRCPKYYQSSETGSSCEPCTSQQYYDDTTETCMPCEGLDGQSYCQSTTTQADFKVNILSVCDVDSYITSDGHTDCKVCPPGGVCDGTTSYIGGEPQSSTATYVATGFGFIAIGGIATALVLFKLSQRKKGRTMSEMVRL